MTEQKIRINSRSPVKQDLAMAISFLAAVAAGQSICESCTATLNRAKNFEASEKQYEGIRLVSSSQVQGNVHDVKDALTMSLVMVDRETKFVHGIPVPSPEPQRSHKVTAIAHWTCNASRMRYLASSAPLLYLFVRAAAVRGLC